MASHSQRLSYRAGQESTFSESLESILKSDGIGGIDSGVDSPAEVVDGHWYAAFESGRF